MQEKGIVKNVNGENVRVAFIKKSGCGGNCHKCNGCPKDTLILDVKNTLDAKIGDEITVEVKQKEFSQMVVLAYIVPGVLFFLGLLLTYMFTHNELLAALVGFVVLVITYTITGRLNKNKEEKYNLTMIKKHR